MRSIPLIVLALLAPCAGPLVRAQTTIANAANFSTMLTLAPGGTATMGFVVVNIPTGQASPWYLIRAVGPSLTQFGITNPAPQPKVTVYNAQGTDISDQTGIPFAFNWNATFASVGAFQLVNGAHDAYLMIRLSPGSYTVQVSDTSKKGGQMLIEAYLTPNPVIVAE